MQIYQIRFLFGMSPGVDSYSSHFGTINNKQNGEQNLSWNPGLECLLLICTYINAKFIVICKPRTFTDGGEDSVKYRNRKKHRFLAAAILLFICKIIITW